MRIREERGFFIKFTGNFKYGKGSFVLLMRQPLIETLILSEIPDKPPPLFIQLHEPLTALHHGAASWLEHLGVQIFKIHQGHILEH